VHYYTSTLHIRYLLTTELAQTLACSLILSRIDYCNAVLHGAPCYNSMKNTTSAEQRSWDRSRGANTIPCQPVVEDVTLAARLIQQRIEYTSTPSYLRRLIQDRQLGHNLRSATTTRRFVNRLRRRHLQSAPSDAQLRLSGTRY